MANASPWGGFMEGIAGGINQASNAMFQAFMQKTMADIDKADEMAKMRFSTGIEQYKIHEGNPDKQKQIVTTMLAPALENFNKRGNLNFSKEDQAQFLSGFNPVAPASKQLMKEMERIIASEAKGKITGEAALGDIQSAMMNYTGTLTKIQEAGMASIQKGLETKVERKGVAGLFADPQKQAAARAGVAYKDIVKKAPTKVAKSFILPDNKTTVLSYDGGLTYRDEAGISQKIPFGSLPITTTLEQAQARSAVGEAKVKITPEITKIVSPEKAAREGTGPYAMLKSFIDSTVGGFSAGAIELFPETMENRQSLRIVKQMGKAVLLNSPRGAIWEQQKIDKLFPNPDIFWTNPATEARKITALRNVMLNEKNHNNQQIASGILSAKEIQKYRNSNAEIDKVITLIGDGKDATRLSAEDENLVNKYLGGQ